MAAVGAVADTAMAVREKLQGKVSTVKVRRYWPGKRPDWATEADDGEDLVPKQQVKTGFDRPTGRESARLDGLQSRDGVTRRPSSSTEMTESKVYRDSEDARLRRLAESRRDREEAVQQHREIRAAEVVTTRLQEEHEKEAQRKAEQEEEEDEEKIEERRRRIRERALQRREEEEVLPQEEEEEEEEESESEYETDSDDSDAGPKLRKPIFVPKAERETIAERERLEAAEAAQEEELKKRLEQRKIETKQIVVEVIRQEEERAKNQEEEGEDVETDDEVNEEEEYEGWKARELARIKRDRAERTTLVEEKKLLEKRLAKEKEELEKLRGMTEEERAEYERRNPKEQTQKAKKKWKFMQKYYHKGAFFQEEPDDKFGTAGTAEIFRRDFSEATGEDKLDKSILPKVMQVKHFGRAGRTKWTHLVDQDTTEWDTPWTTNDPLRAKYNQKMAAMARPIEKPKGSKKLKDWEEPQRRYG